LFRLRYADSDAATGMEEQKDNFRSKYEDPKRAGSPNINYDTGD